MQGWSNTTPFSISLEEYFLCRKHSYSGQYWFQVDCFFTCLQTVTHKEFFPHILMESSPRTQLQQGKCNNFYFLVFQSNFLHPRWTSFIWISIFSKPKDNYSQSILLLPAGGPTLYLTCFVHNPSQVILMKIQTKMGTWKI